MATKFFFTDTASPVEVGTETKKIMSLSQGSSVVSKVTSIPASMPTFTAITDGAGGATLAWFSNPLAPATITAAQVTLNLHGLESAMTTNIQFSSCLIQVCDYGGTAIRNVALADSTTAGAELGTGETTQNFGPTVTAVAIEYGNRLKFVCNFFPFGSTNAGTGTFFYNGAAGATGDSYVSFVDTITELAGPPQPDVAMPRYRYW